MEYQELFKELVKNGTVVRPRGKKCLELLNVKLEPSSDLYESKSRSLLRGKPGDYLYGELAWYFNGDVTTKGIKEFSTMWDNIKNPDGTVNSNYGYLCLYKPLIKTGKSAVEWVISTLQKDPDSRQAIILYNQPEYVHEGNKDFVCTQVQQFFWRAGEVHSTVYIRSSDVIRGLSFDIPWWRVMMFLVANSLQAQVGKLTVFIGSAHVYEEHFDLVKKLAKEPWSKYSLWLDLVPKQVKGHRGLWNVPLIKEQVQIT